VNQWPASLECHAGALPPDATACLRREPAAVQPTPVCIALSTHNGSPYLRDQLASFVAQLHHDWTILWRDDGSSDATREMMLGFAAGEGAGRVVEVSDGRGRLGIAGSFMALVRRTPPGEILAYSDQDDVWFADKLQRGVAALNAEDPERPALYCARQLLVDAALRPLGTSAALRRPAGFPQALTQNIATGCTVMLNPAAVRLLSAVRPPAGTLHDWWSYLVVAAAGGRVIIDDMPSVYYRQHKANAIGVKLAFVPRAVAALRRGPGAFMTIVRAHVAALEEQHDLLEPAAQEALAVIASALRRGGAHRLRALRLPGLRRQNFLETQLFRVWFLLG
jgi:hypothetical protein